MGANRNTYIQRQMSAVKVCPEFTELRTKYQDEVQLWARLEFGPPPKTPEEEVQQSEVKAAALKSSAAAHRKMVEHQNACQVCRRNLEASSKQIA
jgi:hypothetical protein